MDNVVQLKKGVNVIKLNYKTLNSEGFNQALASLANQNEYVSAEAAHNVARLTRQFAAELKRARELYAEWTKPFLVVDETGRYKLAEKKHPLCPWEIQAGKEDEFNHGMDKFLNTEIAIIAKPLTLQDLGNIKLTPVQMLNLEPIFDPSVFSQPEVSAH